MALSARGKTALIGARGDFCPTVALAICGAAYVFVREGDGWVEQQKLIAFDGAVGGGNFGSSVALSAAGTTALIGDSDAECRPAVDGECGAAYVFVRKKSDMWVEQQKVIASDPELGAFFGESVALSVSGKTALVGATLAGCCGAAYVFDK